MNNTLTDNEIERFNALYEEGCELQKNLVILDGSQRKKPGFFGRNKLKKSIQLFKEALAIHPSSWQSMFFIGKAFQALADLESALSWFMKAARIESDNPSGKDEILCKVNVMFVSLSALIS